MKCLYEFWEILLSRWRHSSSSSYSFSSSSSYSFFSFSSYSYSSSSFSSCYCNYSCSCCFLGRLCKIVFISLMFFLLVACFCYQKGKTSVYYTRLFNTSLLNLQMTLKKKDPNRPSCIKNQKSKSKDNFWQFADNVAL